MLPCLNKRSILKITTENICDIDLAVSEGFSIQRTRVEPDVLPAGAKRFSVVTGTHGDELEGQYVCYELLRRVREHPEFVSGVIDVYPAVNPLGIDSMTRGIPHFDLDLNRVFPGREDGCMPEYYAKQVVDSISGSDMSVDIHASNIFLYELPQIRINELTAAELVPWAKKANVDYVWVHSAATVLEATLAYSLNSSGTPCLVVEMGIGMRLTKEYGDQLVDGLLNIMSEMGIWTGPAPEVRKPIVSTDGEVYYINADAPGIFMPVANHTDYVHEGQLVGNILNPLTGEVAQELRAPHDGLMFTLRAYPVVYSGSLIARVLAGVEEVA